MAFYWRGKLDLETEIIKSFYFHSSLELRRHALNFVGRSLNNTQGSIPITVAERLKQLWRKRLQAVSQTVQVGVEELEEYGWWFASGKLDDEWSISQLLEALKLAKQVVPDHLVIERLVEVAEAFPVQCIEALELMVKGDTKGWAILGWEEKAKDVIRTARKSGNSNARQEAEELVNFIGSRGFFDFGKLLNEPAE
jgi:hypothetical protein